MSSKKAKDKVKIQSMIFKFFIPILLLFSCSLIKSGKYYKVRPSDDPFSLAKNFNVSFCSLRESNIDRNFIPGEYIFIPMSAGLIGRLEECQINENTFTKGNYEWPIKGEKKISSPFGPRLGKKHKGIDIPARKGTPILAAKEGVVIFSEKRNSYGLLTIIKHKGGTFTYYAHARKNLFTMGRFVDRGQKIAEVGETGFTRGPHLHFEIRKNNIPFNPLEVYSPII